MADKLYVGETVTVTFEWWDKRISETKPEWRPHSAWMQAVNVEEITLTISKPNDNEDEILTLGAGVEPSGRAGEWIAHFETDGGAGIYNIDWLGEATDGYKSVNVTRVKAKARPA